MSSPGLPNVYQVISRARGGVMTGVSGDPSSGEGAVA